AASPANRRRTNAWQRLRPRSHRECDSASKSQFSVHNADNKPLFPSTPRRVVRFIAVPVFLQEKLRTLKSHRYNFYPNRDHSGDAQVSPTVPDLSLKSAANVHDWTSIRVLLCLPQNFMCYRSRIAFTKRDVFQQI